MHALQRIVRAGRRIIPRGWSPLLRGVGRVYPKARMYPATMADGDRFYLDLRENMCHSYFYYGAIPHESFARPLFEDVVRRGDTFVDLGANIGYFTRFASRLVGSTGCVHAFEPMPEALRILKSNIDGLTNVRVHALAITNSSGEKSFSIKSHGDTSSLGVDADARRVIRVQTDTLDHALRDVKRVDVMKIDVEGFEYEVFEGALEIIRKHRPLIYFECIERYLRERKRSLDDFQALLMGIDYSMSWMNPNYPDSAPADGETATYIVAIPIESKKWSELDLQRGRSA